MPSVLDVYQEFECPNPKCSGLISAKLSDLLSRGKVTCPSCRGTITFGSSVLSACKNAVSAFDKSKLQLHNATAEIERIQAAHEQTKRELEQIKRTVEQSKRVYDASKSKLESVLTSLENAMQYTIKS